MRQIVMNMGKGGTQTTTYTIDSFVVKPSAATKDQLFETVLYLSNFADEHGLEDTARHLEAALDTLM